MKKFKNLLSFTLLAVILTGCSSKSYHEEMIDNTKNSLDKKDYKGIKESYAGSLVDEKMLKKSL